MERAYLGGTGIRVARIILGCGNFGGVGSVPAFFGRGERRDESFAIMDAAWEAGITTFDTADAYGGGRSETWIGEWLRAKEPEVRERVVLSTKTFNPMGEGEDHGLAPARVVLVQAQKHRFDTGARKAKLFTQGCRNEVGRIARIEDRVNMVGPNVLPALRQVIQDIEFRRRGPRVQRGVEEVESVPSDAGEGFPISLRRARDEHVHSTILITPQDASGALQPHSTLLPGAPVFRPRIVVVDYLVSTAVL